MKTEDILKSLSVCGKRVKGCEGCALRGLRKIPDCYDHLKLLAANEIAVLRSENEYLIYGWDANPWVWVIEFERISKEAAMKGENVQ